MISNIEEGYYIRILAAETCMIWCEAMRELSQPYGKTVSHEVGHLFGLEHSEYDPATRWESARDGIMRWKDDDPRDYTCIVDWMDLFGGHICPDEFSQQHIKELRTSADE